ncbi:OLC1v1032005C1 [Oldenlandia corymbosa var. corymbosa]|uniref:1-phosphatidylinositol-3-phosphate 5-kinase n=1 Tax=Oldenlandia corymbosa var. corymbosa TaxID=529605 RepID=A0AAV1CLF8_OLDCO|nr:OLC1v1032005C1 [Oldenlandia corymbosa var. corymbosa]
MGIPDSSLLDLIEKVRSWIFLRAIDPHPSSLPGEFPMAGDGCKFCYECEIDFTESSPQYHCRNCARWLCEKCVQDYGPSEDVFGDSECMKGSLVNFSSCKFCSNLSTQPKAKRKYSDKIYPAESPRQSPEPPSPSCSSERITGYSPQAVSRSSVTLFSGHLSPVSVRRSFSRSDEDDGEDSISNFFSPSSEYFHDTSDTETCSFSTRHEFYSFKSVGSSPSDSPSGMHIISDRVGHPVQKEPATPTYRTDGPFDPENVTVPKGPQKVNEDPEIADDSGENLLMFQEQYRQLPKPLDFENNDLIWFPPRPEHESEDTENDFFSYDDEDDEIGGSNTAFFSNGNMDPKEPLRAVVLGHFRALVSQLLQSEGIKVGKENGPEDWLDIITAISWQAANFVKPDTSRGGSMDPADYVKVKCVASGSPSDSTFIKGVVCTKNIKHKRMNTQYKNPRLLLLGGALEFQGVSNQLESLNVLRQQEMDHLKMIVSKIEALRTNVLLVEKSVSSYAQEYLLAKDISLVLNVKRPLLERIARCTGALVTPTVEKISTARLGHCELFHLEKVLEEHEPSNQFNKKPSKTLMFFGGCPRRLGCTVLLKGLCREELKKLKHVVHYAVFAAYHLSLETSFLADEGASLPKLRANSFLPVEERISPENLISTSTDCVLSSDSQEVDFVTSESPESKHKMKPLTSESFMSDCGSSAAEECGFGDVPIDAQDEAASAGLNDLISVFPGDIQNSNQEESTKTGQQESQPVDGSEIAPHTSVGEIEECYSAADSHQSLLVSFSSRCVPNETVCERSRLLRIKFYGASDKPLGKYLRDDLFDQTSCCQSCKEPTEAHVICYTHQEGNLTINVKRLPSVKLPGERDGKIWMWHRCLKCPLVDGIPPATHRVVMSDAAWGLSFGKFLELSFSNHATANRVANCGHSLQRDCLRYYGYGNMVAFFRYSPIDILSVCLPPPVLEFNASGLEWMRKEVTELLQKVESLYAEISGCLHNIDEKISAFDLEYSDVGELHNHVVQLNDLLSKEKNYYNDMLKISDEETLILDETALDILELNRLRHSLLVGSHVWDRRLYSLNSLLTRNASSRAPRRSEPFVKDSRFENLPEENIRELSRFQELPIETSESKTEEPSALSNGTKSENSRIVTGEHRREDKIPAIGSLETAPSAATVLSDTIDFAWTGCGQVVEAAQLPDLLQGDKAEDILSKQIHPVENRPLKRPMSPSRVYSFDSAVRLQERMSKGLPPASFHLTMLKSFHASGDYRNMIRDPISSVQRTYSQMSPGEVQRFDLLKNVSPSFVSAASLLSDGARLMVRQNSQNDIVIAVYDNEPTSIITYALSTREHEEWVSEKANGVGVRMNARDFKTGISAGSNLSSWPSFGSLDLDYIHYGNYGSEDASSAIGSIFAEQKISPHFRFSFENEGPNVGGKARFSVTCYFAKQFEALRKKCCPSQVDYIRSLSRCKPWRAQGGKSNVYFAKSLDDRFIIKQVTKTELESFEEFAEEYFKYLTDSLNSGSPTCLAKVLGIYQVTTKHSKGGKEIRMDLMVMENLFFRRKISRVYDLKGSERSRYNSDTTGANKVLLDMNLLETLRTKPLFVGSKAKRSLERAVWNDTSFLASADVMDYSLLVGIDDEKQELVLGIIDFMRQYTWDKHLETWVKASGILGGPKNASPTIISPKQYKKRFRKAMTTYFLTVPEQWSSS